jgi:hypothetical protein
MYITMSNFEQVFSVLNFLVMGKLYFSKYFRVKIGEGIGDF